MMPSRRMKRRQNMARNNDLGENSINRIVDGTVFEGNVQSDSNIRVDGVFKGNLSTTGRLVIGASGKITGDIHGTCDR